MTSEMPNLKNLSERLDKVEKENRRLKRAGILIVVLAGSLLVMAQGPRKSKTVEAGKSRIVEGERYILKDSDGNKRAELLMEAAGPGLVLYDPSGKRLGRFGSTGAGNGAGLSLQGPNGESRVTLISRPDGPRLLFFDGGGKFRSELGTNAGGPFLMLYDANGNPRAALAVDTNSPRLQLADEQGFAAVLGSNALVTPKTKETYKTNAASLILFGKNEEVIWRAP